MSSLKQMFPLLITVRSNSYCFMYLVCVPQINLTVLTNTVCILNLPEDIHLILERLCFISQSCELFVLGFHVHKFFFKLLTTNPVVVLCCLQPTENWEP